MYPQIDNMDSTPQLRRLIEQVERLERHLDSAEERQRESMSAGMRAGSEFMAYVIAGGLVGYTAGHFFGHMALWLMIMLFAGFGYGMFRAAKAMK